MEMSGCDCLDENKRVQAQLQPHTRTQNTVTLRAAIAGE